MAQSERPNYSRIGLTPAEKIGLGRALAEETLRLTEQLGNTTTPPSRSDIEADFHQLRPDHQLVR